MENEVLIRLIWALMIAAAGWGLYALANRAILARAQHNPLPGARKGVLAILYFTTPECAPCRTVQRPALAQIQARLGERLQVIEVDASRQPEMAAQWGVMTVPTTFLIDARGRTRQVNHGVTRADTLIEQLSRLEATPPA